MIANIDVISFDCGSVSWSKLTKAQPDPASSFVFTVSCVCLRPVGSVLRRAESEDAAGLAASLHSSLNRLTWLVFYFAAPYTSRRRGGT